MYTYCKKKTRGFLEKIIYFRVYLLICFLHTFMRKSDRKRERGWRCLFWSGCPPLHGHALGACGLLDWACTHVWGYSTCCPITSMRPFHMVFKLMFSIFTLFWISGFHGPRTGVWAGKICAPVKGSQPHICSSAFPLFLVSIIWEGDMPGHVIVPLSCRKSCFLWAQSCTEVNMSMS